jgi:DNA primase
MYPARGTGSESIYGDDSAYKQVTAEELLDHIGVDYRRTSGSRGRQFQIRECPTCGRSDWKVYLGEDSGYGNCFHGSCETKYNLWTFAAAHLGNPESKEVGALFEEIAKAGGWKPKARPQRVIVPAFEGDLELPRNYHLPDRNGSVGIYLAGRGITPDLARAFDLRHGIGSYNYVDEDGQAKSISFAGRIIFPIYDANGKLVTFQGRDTTGTSDRKYLFPARLPSTARFIYNAHRAKAEGWAHGVMGEGTMDVIGIQRAIDEDRNMRGIGAIGSFGKSLTLDIDPNMPTQLQALLELKAAGMKIITIMWDGEWVALKSAVKAAGKLQLHGFLVRIALMPKDKDPADVESRVVRKSIECAIPYTRSLEAKLRLRDPYNTH